MHFQEICNSFSNTMHIWDIMIWGIARCFVRIVLLDIAMGLIESKVYFHYNAYSLLADTD